MDYNAQVLEQELRKPWKIKQDIFYQQSFLAAANEYNYGVRLPAISIQDQDIELMEWSLYPNMPSDIAKKVRNGTYNCRSEEAIEKKSFKGPINKGQFCLIPSSWILEFHTIPKRITGGKKDLKIPFRITNKENFFAIPGLWNPYKNEQGETIRTFTMLTKHGGDVFSKIHNAPKYSRDCRQVVMFGHEYWDAWLDEKFSWDDRLELIEEGVIKDEELVYHPVRHPNKLKSFNIPEMKEDYREYDGIEKIQYPELLE